MEPVLLMGFVKMSKGGSLLGVCPLPVCFSTSFRRVEVGCPVVLQIN